MLEAENRPYWMASYMIPHVEQYTVIVKTCSDILTLSKILCKWEQDSVISFFLYLDSVFKDKYKLVHNQSPV